MNSVPSARFEADPLNSTFRWVIHLDPNHARNRVAQLDGYSKGMGYENNNKVQLLLNKLRNPLLGYVEKALLIEVFEQQGGVLKERHPRLITLSPHGYHCADWVAENELICQFLKGVYDTYLTTGQLPSVENRRNNRRQGAYQRDLKHDLYRFNDHGALQVFCREQSAHYGQECMRSWYYSHLRLFPALQPGC